MGSPRRPLRVCLRASSGGVDDTRPADARDCARDLLVVRSSWPRGCSTRAVRDLQALYRRRQQIVDPLFAHTKFIRRTDRFLRGGLAACQAERQLLIVGICYPFCYPATPNM